MPLWSRLTPSTAVFVTVLRGGVGQDTKTYDARTRSQKTYVIFYRNLFLCIFKKNCFRMQLSEPLVIVRYLHHLAKRPPPAAAVLQAAVELGVLNHGSRKLPGCLVGLNGRMLSLRHRRERQHCYRFPHLLDRRIIKKSWQSPFHSFWQTSNL